MKLQVLKKWVASDFHGIWVQICSMHTFTQREEAIVQINLQSKCIGTDTFCRLAPVFIASCSAALLTIASTSGSDWGREKPSTRSPSRRWDISLVNCEEENKAKFNKVKVFSYLILIYFFITIQCFTSHSHLNTPYQPMRARVVTQLFYKNIYGIWYIH